MSLTSVVALLQSALILLQLAQSTPSLPQSVRDQAEQIAQTAISEATNALASQHAEGLLTTPSGAVVTEDGTLVSTPAVR